MVDPQENLAHLTDAQLRAKAEALFIRLQDRRMTLAATAAFILEVSKDAEDPATRIDLMLRGRDTALEIAFTDDAIGTLRAHGGHDGPKNS